MEALGPLDMHVYGSPSLVRGPRHTQEVFFFLIINSVKLIYLGFSFLIVKWRPCCFPECLFIYSFVLLFNFFFLFLHPTKISPSSPLSNSSPHLPSYPPLPSTPSSTVAPQIQEGLPWISAGQGISSCPETRLLLLLFFLRF